MKSSHYDFSAAGAWDCYFYDYTADCYDLCVVYEL